MQLDKAFIETIITLYEELNINGIYIVYIGKFTQKITSMFSSMLEEELEKENVEKKVKRRVYHAIVETMQNIQKHADRFDEKFFSDGLFMIGKIKHIYYIITVNKVQASKRESVAQAIEQVNNKSLEELNEMYKQQLKNGKINEEGGAGLGLIDIVRKTRNNIDYMFIPININEQYFIFKAEVDPLKFYVDE